MIQYQNGTAFSTSLRLELKEQGLTMLRYHIKRNLTPFCSYTLNMSITLQFIPYFYYYYILIRVFSCEILYANYVQPGGLP